MFIKRKLIINFKYSIGMIVESNNKSTKLYFNENDFNIIRVSSFIFEVELVKEKADLLKKILIKYTG